MSHICLTLLILKKKKKYKERKNLQIHKTQLLILLLQWNFYWDDLKIKYNYANIPGDCFKLLHLH